MTPALDDFVVGGAEVDEDAEGGWEETHVGWVMGWGRRQDETGAYARQIELLDVEQYTQLEVRPRN